MHVHDGGATNLPSSEEGGGRGWGIRWIGMGNIAIMCIVLLNLGSGGLGREGGLYTRARGYNGKILSGWNSAGCSQDWRRLEIEWVRNSRLEIETISGYGISLMLLFRSPLPFLENYFSYRKGKIVLVSFPRERVETIISRERD